MKKVFKVSISILLMCMPVMVFAAETVGIFSDSSVPQIKFAVGDVKTALESKGFTVEMLPMKSISFYSKKKVVIALLSDSEAKKLVALQGGEALPTKLGEEGYCIRTTKKGQSSYWILGADVNGAMYGTFQIAEEISFSGFSGEYNTQETPFLAKRGMKLNLPLDNRTPTYVGRWTSNSAKKAIPHVWDMTFWKNLIDQQARYRYNVLSVWVHHPFPALVKLTDYPNVSLPYIEGFEGFENKELVHEKRVAFWREVMRYAHDRGMKFYFFNWNIHLEHAKKMNPELKEDPKNPTTIDYMYKSMRALIDTYPELDGFGISAGDGMHGTRRENTEWTWQAMGKAVNDYMRENPKRKFNLIHRGIKTSIETVDSIYAPLKSTKNVQLDFSVKYAQAHMYSTPTPKWVGNIGAIGKLGFKTWLTVRNDDYFYLNWGDPQFVRDYMNGIPDKETVIGMYVGSDGYNPSRTYFCKDAKMNGQLEVERRWYMEMLWGRISYNPKISDDVFVKMLAKRYPTVDAKKLFEAWSLSSRGLCTITELIMSKWSLDFHWYPEGCWSDPGRETGFRTIDGMANETSVAKGSDLCDIANSATGKCNGKQSSYKTADIMQANAEKALNLVDGMKSRNDADLGIAVENIKQMAYLSSYYAFKVRGATFKKAGEIEKARNEMAKAYCMWIKYTRAMEATYFTDSFRSHSIQPDWKYGDAAVLKEYTDLGGVGIPSCK